MEEIRTKCIFSCAKQNISFYPFFLPYLYTIFRFYKDQIINSSYPNNYKYVKYNLPILFYLYLPKILAIIFIPIIKCKTKGESHEIKRLSRQYHKVAIKKSKKKMFLLIYIISLLEVIQENGDLLLYYYQSIKSIKWLVEKKTGLIIFVPFLCKCLLKIDLFSHHILALILGFIGAFIINFCRFPLGFSRIEDCPYHLLNIFFSFVLSCAFVLIKYVMIHFVIESPYSFLFYNGIFNIINSFIYISLEYFIVEKLPIISESDYEGSYFSVNFLGIFTLLKGQEFSFYIYFFLAFIVLFTYYILTALTIYNFSPYLIIIVETCLPIDNDMIEIFYGLKEFNNERILERVLYQLIGYIFIIISALILNETIILNFFGLNKNIRSNISSRSELDVDRLLGLRNDDEETEFDENNNIHEINLNIYI